MCPVLPDEKADPQITTQYEGKTVALCCDRCLALFEMDPTAYVDKLPQFAGVATDGENGHDVDEEPASHDHSTDPAVPVEPDRPPWLGRLHPVLVHLPLAGLPLALLAYLVWLFRRSDSFARADVVPLLASTVGAIAAVITGNMLHDAMRFNESMHVIVERHQFFSTSVMVLAIVLSGIRMWHWAGLTGGWRVVYLVGLLIGCAMLGITGHLGGSLVFGPDHLQW